MIQANIDKLKIVPCKCGSYAPRNFNMQDGHFHWSDTDAETFTHFKLRGQWYILPSKFARALLSLIEVEDGMSISGAMHRPKPVRIERTLTSFFALLRRMGLSEEQIATQFPPEQVSRMKGRVFNKLVKGK